MDGTIATPHAVASHAAKHSGPTGRKASGPSEASPDPFTALLAGLLSATGNVAYDLATSPRTATESTGNCQPDGKCTPFSTITGPGKPATPDGTSLPLPVTAGNEAQTPAADTRIAASTLESAAKADTPAPISVPADLRPKQPEQAVLAADTPKPIAARANATPAVTPSIPVIQPANPQASSETPHALAQPIALEALRPAGLPAEPAFQSVKSSSTEATPPRVDPAPATSAPATSAPATSAPATSAPATSAPATSAPATSAPATLARGPAATPPATPLPSSELADTTTPVQARSDTHSVQPSVVVPSQPLVPAGRPDAAPAAQDSPAQPLRARDTRTVTMPPTRISEAMESARDAAATATANGTAEATRETPPSAAASGQRPGSIPLQTPAAANRLAEQVTYMAQRDLQHATIQVDPAELGPIQIRVTLGSHDQLQIQFTAAQAQTREALEGHLPRLREVLAESGFSQLNVDVSGNPDHQRQAATHYSQGDSRQSHTPWRLPREESPQPHEAPATSHASRVGEGARLDVFA